MTKRLSFTALGLLVGFGLVALPAQGQQYVASTVAGINPVAAAAAAAASSGTTTTTPLTIGDGGAPTSAKLMAPCSVAYSNGNLFVLENAGQRVRLVNNSVINTVGGYTSLATTTIGNIGYAGDGAAANASTAAFNYPQ